MDHEAGLRASQDRDLGVMAAALRAQKDLLQALATTQSEHTAKLDRLDRAVGRLENRMQQIVGKPDLLIEREGGR